MGVRSVSLEDGLCMVDDEARNAPVVLDHIHRSIKHIAEIRIDATQVKEAWFVTWHEVDEQIVIAVFRRASPRRTSDPNSWSFAIGQRRQIAVNLALFAEESCMGKSMRN